MENQETPTLVIDNGSQRCKGGYAGEDAPHTAFPTVIGRLTSPIPTIDLDYFVGQAALFKRAPMTIKCPIERGMITDWDDMERIWHYLYFYNLRIFPDEQPAVITENPFTPKADREKMIDVFFDTFNVPSFYVGMQSVFSLYASGRTTGIVLESGEEVSRAVPIYDGYSLRNGISRIDIAGKNVTEYFSKLLKETGYDFTTNSEREIVREIKERSCFVALDYEKVEKEAEESSVHDYVYELPEGNCIYVGNPRFKAPEILFNPSMIGLEFPGIHELTFGSIMKCDAELRQSLYQNIVVSGGTTFTSGLPERLSKELASLAPSTTKIEIDAPLERKWSAWIGGSVLASISSFQHMSISRSEYNEFGGSIVHRKCF